MNVNKLAYSTLVIGMILSSLFLASSLAINLLWPDMRSLSSTVASVGVGILVLTPYAGVLVVTVTSAVNKDFKLMAISLAVLIVMLVGLLLGFHFKRAP